MQTNLRETTEVAYTWLVYFLVTNFTMMTMTTNDNVIVHVSLSLGGF